MDNRQNLINDLHSKFGHDNFSLVREYLTKAGDELTVVYKPTCQYISEIDVITDDSMDSIRGIKTLYSAEFVRAATGGTAPAWDVIPLNQYHENYNMFLDTVKADLNTLSTSPKIVLHQNGRAYVALGDNDLLQIMNNKLLEDCRDLTNIEKVQKASTILVSIKNNGLSENDIKNAGFRMEQVAGSEKVLVLNDGQRDHEFRTMQELIKFVDNDMTSTLVASFEALKTNGYAKETAQATKVLMDMYCNINEGQQKDLSDYMAFHKWKYEEKETKAKIHF